MPLLKFNFGSITKTTITNGAKIRFNVSHKEHQTVHARLTLRRQFQESRAKSLSTLWSRIEPAK
jgi:hypothetical protein